MKRHPKKGRITITKTNIKERHEKEQQVGGDKIRQDRRRGTNKTKPKCEEV